MLWAWVGAPACVLHLRTVVCSHSETGSPLAFASPWQTGGCSVGASHSKCFSFRGHKRKLNDDDAASESSRESSCEDEGSSSEADEMAAALEAELDLM